MNSKQLYNAAHFDGVTKDYGFLGVFSPDTVPVRALTSFPYTLIVNTEDSTRPGAHWVSIHKDIMQNGWYFDSYGGPPKLDEFLAVMDSCKDWTYNTHRLQSNVSTVCGQYCLFFITHSARGYGLEEIVHLLDQDNDKMVNDAIVNEYIKDRFDFPNLPVVDYPFLFSQIANLPNS
jgi:hypothetical protein